MAFTRVPADEVTNTQMTHALILQCVGSSRSHCLITRHSPCLETTPGAARPFTMHPAAPCPQTIPKRAPIASPTSHRLVILCPIFCLHNQLPPSRAHITRSYASGGRPHAHTQTNTRTHARTHVHRESTGRPRPSTDGQRAARADPIRAPPEPRCATARCLPQMCGSHPKNHRAHKR